MQWPLLLSGLAMGVAAMPHCAVMCAAPCSALTQGRRADMLVFQVGRLLSYASVGALAAHGVAMLEVWRQTTPALRPLWTMLHLAFLALGLCWLSTGRHPTWLCRDAAKPPSVIQRVAPSRRLRSASIGLAWVAWPCAALQGALLLAALGNEAAMGACVMVAFALASMPGLVLAPWAWRRWRAWRGGADGNTAQGINALAFRLGGIGLVLGSGWALTRGLWQGLAAWCGAA